LTGVKADAFSITVDWDRSRFDRFLEMMENGDAARTVAGNLAAEARKHWQHLAEAGLDTTSQLYIAGLGQPEPVEDPADQGAVAFAVVLDGTLPNWLEQGVDPFDMREEDRTNILSGAKTAKDGTQYKVIPLTHTLPGSVASTMPQGPGFGATPGVRHKPLGHAYQPVAGSMSLRATPPSAGQLRGIGVNSPAQLAARVAQAIQEPGAGALSFAGRAKQVLTLQAITGGMHSRPIYGGMRLEGATFDLGKGMQATTPVGRTFRTVTEDNEGWLHPGLMARNFAEQTAEYLRGHYGPVVQAAIDDIVRSLG
jgi:hypothetical protein